MLNIAQRLSQAEHRPHFAGRTLGLVQESCEILLGSALKTFRDIVHHRDRCALNLVTEAKITTVSEMPVNF